MSAAAVASGLASGSTTAWFFAPMLACSNQACKLYPASHSELPLQDSMTQEQASDLQGKPTNSKEPTERPALMTCKAVILCFFCEQRACTRLPEAEPRS